MKNLILLLSAIIFIETEVFAQNLSIEPNRGILIPKISTLARNSIGSPSSGLMIYNTDTNKFNYYDGAAWQEAFFGNQWAVNGSNISYSGGNVGIGTATPAAQLNIFDNSAPRLQFNTTNTGTTINDGLYIGNNNVSKGFVWNYENAALALGTNNAEQLIILGNGNVGIGNNNPLQKLSVNGNVVAPTLSLNTTNVAPNANAILDMTSTTKGILIPRMTTIQRNTIPTTAGLMVYDTDTDGFWFNNGTAWFDLNSTWDRDEAVTYSNAKNLSTVVGIGLTPLPTSGSAGGSVTNGRLQIVGSSNADQLTIRHPNSPILRWGFYVSSIDSSLNFYYNGSLRANIDRVTGVYAALSDKRLKKNITAINPLLNKVLSLNAYNYNMLDADDNSRKSMGFMAQDVQLLFPELVYNKRDRETNEPFLMMDYSSFGVIAIKAIQEQQVIINNLQSQIDELRSILSSLKK